MLHKFLEEIEADYISLHETESTTSADISADSANDRAAMLSAPAMTSKPLPHSVDGEWAFLEELLKLYRGLKVGGEDINAASVDVS